jgi:hypothetical protein
MANSMGVVTAHSWEPVTGNSTGVEMVRWREL